MGPRPFSSPFSRLFTDICLNIGTFRDHSQKVRLLHKLLSKPLTKVLKSNFGAFLLHAKTSFVCLQARIGPLV